MKSSIVHRFNIYDIASHLTVTGVILLDILPQGQCINAARYCSTLDRLKEAIRRKRPGLLRRGVVLQHDNATPHSANLTHEFALRSQVPFYRGFETRHRRPGLMEGLRV
ncbi:histone-lysine N-methyltransferase SETMAR [Plakobranchus ocellatus]|uniref:Histone-lysine N-methyltransferase SETMAR n=1 Tax=Plakobranchus ocellatus TaxID=259542 RepID=A0AAV4DQ19_9GAST|nr:histone-lysine N-methyltransferase SETMAR [Plakobranchus ocellatus]